MLREIAAALQVEIQAQLTGGTEALLFGVAQRSGRPAVLKVGLPGSLVREASTLELADGTGYARLLAFDPSRSAMLLERLGEQLAEGNQSTAVGIEIICETLKVAWRELDGTCGLMTGAQKARSQRDYIEAQWTALGEPCEKQVRDRGIDFADEREGRYDSDSSWMLHGDAHVWNTLADPSAPSGYKLVDPDGVFGERAFDLSILMREWREDLLAGDALERGEARCARLGELTGVDTDAIWQWGFVEQVSCGLLDTALGDRRNADRHFAIARQWLRA